MDAPARFAYRTALTLFTVVYIGTPAAEPADLPRPPELVRGAYYFEDQGLYTTQGGDLIYSENYHDGAPIDFAGRVLFTFDDVVFDDSLDRILDALEDREIPAVFFLSGRHMLGVDPSATTLRLERMIASGHRIGNHSYSHDQFDRGIFADGYRDFRDVADDLDRLEALIDTALGYHYPVRLVRPPFGIRGNDARDAEDRMARPGTVDRVVAARGQELVLWHINSLDFLIVPGGRYRPEDLPSLASRRVQESLGGVILFHSNRFTASVIEETIDAILAVRTRAGDPVRPTNIEEIYAIKYESDGTLTQVR